MCLGFLFVYKNYLVVLFTILRRLMVTFLLSLELLEVVLVTV